MTKHPKTKELAESTYRATGCRTHGEFCALTGGAISVRTFRRWLAGDGAADGLAQLVLRNLASGWRPRL
jgi:hypothetical protein